MKEYNVLVREVHIQTVRVTAEDPEDAKDRVADGEGIFLDNALEYSHSLDSEYWTVEEV